MTTTSTILLLLLALVAFTSAGRPVVTEALIERINSEQSTWEAAANGFLGMNKEEVSMFLGAKLGDRSLPLKELVVEIADEDIPASFDASQKWPHCPSITHIRDQSACGSCWAVSFAEVASDRSCIALNINVTLSAADMAFCCSSCGDGCNGGYPSAAWEYYSSTGVVTTKCDPYPFPSCMHHVPPGPGTPPACPSQEYPNQPCPTGCKTGLSWSNDLHYGASAYGITGVAEIQKEIMTNGPVQGTFMVYSDFPTYKSGVYQRSRSASPIGGHAIKIVGWGEENGIPYWKIANSWNKYWGQDGYVLFLRGQDECGIEDGVVAGIPKN